MKMYQVMLRAGDAIAQKAHAPKPKPGVQA